MLGTTLVLQCCSSLLSVLVFSIIVCVVDYGEKETILAFFVQSWSSFSEIWHDPVLILDQAAVPISRNRNHSGLHYFIRIQNLFIDKAERSRMVRIGNFGSLYLLCSDPVLCL